MARADGAVAAFLMEVPLSMRDSFGLELEAEVVAVISRGHAAFAEISLGDETFARHLGRVFAWHADGTRVSSLVAEDLYLACACLVRAPGAADTLATRYGSAIRRAIARVVRGPDAEEIEQHLLTEILVGSHTSPPEIGTYAGRAPLERWLEVLAHRAALLRLRGDRREAQVRARTANEPSLATETPVETIFLRERYQGDYEQSLKQAFGRIPKRDRAVLRLHLVNNVSVEKIGRMLGVSQSTASRWLVTAREALLSDLKSILRERLRISSAEIESLAGLVADRLDLTVSQLLRTG